MNPGDLVFTRRLKMMSLTKTEYIEEIGIFISANDEELYNDIRVTIYTVLTCGRGTQKFLATEVKHINEM